jgi:hypothetical protein
MFETSVSLVKLDFETKISPALTGEINHMTTKLTKEIRKISLADRTRSDAENLTRSKPCPSRAMRYCFAKTIADMLHDIDGEESTGFKDKYATDPSAFCKLA